MKRPILFLSGCLLLLSLSPIPSQGKGFWLHMQRTRNRHGLPNHNYSDNAPRFGVTVSSNLAPATEEVLITKMKHHAKQRRAVPVLTKVLRKRFLLGKRVVAANFVTLDSVQLAIYSTGEVVCTGRILNLAGNRKELFGNCVRIEVRAYGGVEQDGLVSPIGPMLWRFEQKRWVRKNRPEVIYLTPTFSEEVRQHFREITRMEVHLEYQIDR